MAHLIDKDALIAEIERLKNIYKKCPTRNSYDEGLKAGRLIGYQDALHKIHASEAKEVDLETAFATMIDVFDEKCGPHWCEEDLKEFAKHFFELGLKVNNEKEK